MPVERGHRSWQIHVDGHLDASQLAADLDVVRAGGGGPVFVWVTRPTDEDDAVAEAAGLQLGRDLWEMRAPLPLPSPVPDLVWRPFQRGLDEDAWLEVNNRAFDWHPEQGGWTREKLEEALAEPWVDLSDFLVHERDYRMAGFCWTKLHPATEEDPALGEVYVIGVHPDFHGLGLGSALNVVAMDWVHRRHGIDVGNLYVDATNEPAVRMYEKLGYSVHHVDRAYSGDVEPG
jgi:mycothiol synthase